MHYGCLYWNIPGYGDALHAKHPVDNLIVIFDAVLVGLVWQENAQRVVSHFNGCPIKMITL